MAGKATRTRPLDSIPENQGQGSRSLAMVLERSHDLAEDGKTFVVLLVQLFTLVRRLLQAQSCQA